MKKLLLALSCLGARAENITDTSMLLQLQETGDMLSDKIDSPSMGRCWHWIADKFWDCLAFPDPEGDDNFIGKVLNVAIGEQTYGSGGSFSMDVSALTMSGIIALSEGERGRFRSDRSIEGWRVRSSAPCRGHIKDRDVTASCCNGVTFALASFPRLNQVAILLEAKKPGMDKGYTYHIVDPTFNRFQDNAVERRKVKVLMEELQLASNSVKIASGGMEAKSETFKGFASYDNFRQYYISMDTFFRNGGDLRYAVGGTEGRFRTFKSQPDPSVCFGHGPLLQRASQKWLNATTAES